ncbi:Patatin [Paenibacillus curdlanolyticus YK9]|uniref:Patatin n=1 Tax=Paenibacillus curdlanolyticus YK9 TaxID=717606 RepID=E0I7N4_9BACL|nr:patatin-like phospholipase family protein [Paenibacillus curdlanolyticus]EFM11189.1 Patatin [Paenibacillus curdlanolyticus YK9]
MKADAVFEGGGVRGIALAGAIQVFEDAGYTWERVAGTSAGAIIAALLASGFTAAELKSIIESLQYRELLGRGVLNRIPLFGGGLSLLFKLGLYSNEKLEQWMSGLLLQKNIRTFSDLPPGKLTIIASDISNGKMLVLPDDLHEYGISPEQFPIATAVRMSTSIPFFFQPYRWRSPISVRPTFVVDGGILSNYPIWLFDTAGEPRWPTFGFKLSERHTVTDPVRIKGPLSMSRALFKTMLQAHDQRHVDEHGKSRTIFIPTGEITSTQFSLGPDAVAFLRYSGAMAAESFLSSWDFAVYKSKFRSS